MFNRKIQLRHLEILTTFLLHGMCLIYQFITVHCQNSGVLIRFRNQLAGNNEMDFSESGHVNKSYPAAVCERSTEPSVSIKDGEFLISQATTSFLWKN